MPVRRYGEGTNEREWAQVMTNYFTQKNFAEGAAGNHFARWIDYHGAMQSLGLEDA